MSEVGRYLSLEWQEWVNSDDGIRCRTLWTLGSGGRSVEYLQNRLKEAFLAGARAQRQYDDAKNG